MVAGPEVELKFLFAEKDVAKVKALVAAASGARKATYQRLRTIYFDTPNQDLWNHGFTLRVRANGDNHVQTVKRMASSRVQRDEWEEEIGRPEPNLERIKYTTFARLAGKAAIRHAMRPAFELDVERTSFMLETGGGRIEAAFDQGAIKANGEQLGVRELELEIEKRRPVRLVQPCPRLCVAGAAPSKPNKQTRARSSSYRGSLGPGGEKFKAASCQGHDVSTGVPGNLSDLSTRLSFESPRFGEVRQCRGISPRTHRD
jgi:CYTH domain